MKRRTWKDDLRDADLLFLEGKYKEAVYNYHTALTMAMEEVLLARKGEYFLITAARKLLQLNKLSKDDFKNLIWLNELRNKIYHRAYTPTQQEVNKVKSITYATLKRLKMNS
jgi:HEPN domain-containing protein